MSEKTAVVMATYNGMKYLEAQLDSLRLQTKKPDQVIICDDVSTDGTGEFLFNYVKRYYLDEWKVIQNEKNLGWIKNFYHLFDLTTADIIFCADQDDLWMPDKIEVMSEIMVLNQEIKVLGGNNILVSADAKLADLPSARAESKIRKIKWNNKFYLTRRPGCALCFRKELLDHIKNIRTDNYPHDRLLWNIACILEGAYLVDRDIILQRRHGDSAMIRKKKQNNRVLEIEQQLKAIKELKKYVSEIMPNDFKKEKLITETEAFFEMRTKFLKQGNFKDGLWLLRYLSFYPRYRSYLADLKAGLMV